MAPHRQELEVVPKPWNKSVLAAFTAMTQQLFVTNRTLNDVLGLWYRSCVAGEASEAEAARNMLMKK